MKKMFLLILALCLMLSLCACGGETVEETPTEEPTEEVTQAPTGETTGAPAGEVTGAPAGEGTDTPDETKPSGTVYTVKVVDEEGNPIGGARVQLCQGEICLLPTATDENGVVTFSVDKADAYEAKLAEVPAGYEYATDQEVFAFGDGFEQTITLKAVQGVVYTVKVVDEGGNPIAGAKVQLCQGEICLLPTATDENGVVTFSVDKVDAYEAKITEVPAGYELIAEEQIFPFGNFLEITITLKAVA